MAYVTKPTSVTVRSCGDAHHVMSSPNHQQGNNAPTSEGIYLREALDSVHSVRQTLNMHLMRRPRSEPDKRDSGYLWRHSLCNVTVRSSAWQRPPPPPLSPTSEGIYLRKRLDSRNSARETIKLRRRRDHVTNRQA